MSGHSECKDRVNVWTEKCQEKCHDPVNVGTECRLGQSECESIVNVRTN
jgi:hypothetical protein